MYDTKNPAASEGDESSKKRSHEEMQATEQSVPAAPAQIEVKPAEEHAAPPKAGEVQQQSETTDIANTGAEALMSLFSGQ
jgi:hypothetical protein